MLDLLLMTGSDALTAVAHPRISIFNSVGWSSERNFHRHIGELRQEGWIEWEEDPNRNSWVFIITDYGKSTLLDNIHPEESWSRPWDGKWRTISFDLPQNAGKARQRLNGWLKRRRFGHLQGSVWISHRPYGDWEIELEKLEVDPRSVLIQEGTPLGSHSDADYVMSAWNFEEINGRYQDFLTFLESVHPLSSRTKTSPADWLKKESTLWQKAFKRDPFLPSDLLPPGYLGKIAWRARKTAYSQLRKQLFQDFEHGD